MGQYDYRQAFKNISLCLLVLGLMHYEPALVIDGFGKLIVFLVLAILLIFAVSRSADIRRATTIALVQSLPTFLFPFVAERASIQQLPAEVVVPPAPSLSPRFQRPPPFVSL